MLEVSILNFLKDAAGMTPVPGGGSISALTGAMGSAMAHMSAIFSTSEKYENVREQINSLLEHFSGALERFAILCDEDAIAYGKLNEAMKMPRATEAEKQMRKAAIQLALLDALNVPMEVCSLAVTSLKKLVPLVSIGNQNLVSDVGVASSMLNAAFEGARLNVEINLAWIEDKEKVKEARSKLDGWSMLAKELSDGIYRETIARIRK